MKNLLLLIVVAFMATSLSACGGKDKRASVRTGGDRGDRGGVRNLSNCNFKGTSRSEIRTEQSRVEQFLSAQGDPRELIGSIDVSGGGVFFTGGADLNGNTISCANISLEILDNFYVNREVDAPLPIDTLKFVSGTMVGGSNVNDVQDIDIKFEDSYQSLILDGESRNGTFSGTVIFKNKKDFEGLDPWQGPLGTFSIPTCNFFDCRN